MFNSAPPEYQRVLTQSADAHLAQGILAALFDNEERAAFQSLRVAGGSRWLSAAPWMELLRFQADHCRVAWGLRLGLGAGSRSRPARVVTLTVCSAP